MKPFFYLLLVLSVLSCSNSTTPAEYKHYGLPQSFPLKVGNAWSYKITDYNPDQNRVRSDTLYISGEYGVAYKMSYHPDHGYAIVKNDQDKLLVIGEVSTYGIIDTTIFDKPFIWTFFNIDTGFVDTAQFNGYDCYTDSVHISIVKNMEFINNLYDVYVVKYYLKNSQQWTEQVISADGLMRERNYTGNVLKTERLIQSKTEDLSTIIN